MNALATNVLKDNQKDKVFYPVYFPSFDYYVASKKN